MGRFAGRKPLLESEHYEAIASQLLRLNICPHYDDMCDEAGEDLIDYTNDDTFKRTFSRVILGDSLWNESKFRYLFEMEGAENLTFTRIQSNILYLRFNVWLDKTCYNIITDL